MLTLSRFRERPLSSPLSLSFPGLSDSDDWLKKGAEVGDRRGALRQSGPRRWIRKGERQVGYYSPRANSSPPLGGEGGNTHTHIHALGQKAHAYTLTDEMRRRGICAFVDTKTTILPWTLFCWALDGRR